MVVSPVLPGYAVDVRIVSGLMEDGGLVYDVIYTPRDFTLTIRYVTLDGKEVAPSHQETLRYQDAYSVESPALDGMICTNKLVDGTMPARDVVITVIYVKKGNGLTIIDEYDVPLGLGQVAINAGDCFE